MKLYELFEKEINKFKLNKPYIIAEAGVNHENDINIAKILIKEAKEAGADAIKFQTYKAETIASKNSPSYWDLSKEPTTSQYELFKKHDFFWLEEMKELKSYCDQIDIEFMSTPFDIESANFLNDIMDVFKISSSDITNKPFIQHICSFNKPIILSTGASNLDEIKDAVSWIEEKGNSFALLHCVLNYPTKDENANLGMIMGLQKEFPNKIIGYSDHTLPKNMKICETAILLGAIIIEKHFTHDKLLPGNDHYHAMDKDDLKLFTSNINKLFTSLGEFNIIALEEENLARQNARRSLVLNKHMSKGQIILKDDLTFKRPAFGISPKDIDSVIGKELKENACEDDILQWEMLND